MSEAPVVERKASAAPAGGGGGFGVFAQLTRAIRHAETVEALRFSIVNETRRLVTYRQAALLCGDGATPRVAALSGVPVVERQTPLARWLEELAAAVIREDPGAGGLHPLDADIDGPGPTGAVGRALGEGRAMFGTANPLWCPLVAPGGRRVGVLILDRAEPWRETEALLLRELADAQAHALLALTGGRDRPKRWRHPAAWAVIAALALGISMVPVRRAVLAPTEIIAEDPEVVSAPIDGVIRAFQVEPNQRVEPGDPLFTLDDTDRQARVEVAEKALDIARVEYRQASQGALGGRRDGPKLSALEAQIALKEVELEAARHELERTRARAGKAGVVLLPDPQEWIGRPVATGERVMLIADPDQVMARGWLAVRDVAPLEPGAPVRVFLDADPLAPLDGELLRAGHDAETEPGGGLAYRLLFRLAAGEPGVKPPRIGLKGTARVEADRVPLFLYLFRRPIAALRQAAGF